MRGKTTSLVDVAFRATSLGLFTVTVVSGAWFLATTVKGFTHYSAQHEAMKRREVEAEARRGEPRERGRGDGLEHVIIYTTRGRRVVDTS